MNKDLVYKIRLSEGEKKKLKDLAASTGLKMSEVILYLLKKEKLPDKKYQHELFTTINKLSKEINYIGKNINQITMALRQINTGKKIEEGEYRELLIALHLFEEKRKETAAILLKSLHL